MRALFAVVALMTVVACTTPREAPVDSTTIDTAARPQPASVPWDEARRRGIDFRAIGQEPGWMIEIDNGKSIYVLADYGEKKVTTPAPAPRDSAGLTIYEATADTHRLTIVIRKTTCHDAMSGEEMTHTVTFTLDGNEYQGCGRDLGDRG